MDYVYFDVNLTPNFRLNIDIPEKISEIPKDYSYQNGLSIFGMNKIHTIKIKNYQAFYWNDYNKNEIVPIGILKLPSVFDDFL